MPSGMITTRGSEIKTEAQKRAEEERARESAQLAEAQRQETLRAAADAGVQKVAAEIVLEKERQRQGIAPLEAEERPEEREEDEARVEKLMDEHRRGISTSYRGLNMFFTPAMKDRARSVEAGLTAGRLGRSNPLTVGLMSIGDGVGIIQNELDYKIAICERMIVLLRAHGGLIDKDLWESYIG